MPPISLLGNQLLSIFQKTTSKIDRNLLIILLLPLLVFFLNKDWVFFTTKGSIDSGVYLGYFLNLKQHLQTYPSAYYGSRLSWIIPGYIAYHLFPPIIANFILRIGLYYASVIPLYLILKYTINRRAALLTAIFMGCYCYFLLAISWDYVDGVGIAYYLLTMLTLTLGAKFIQWKVWLCLSGVFCGGLIYSNIFWITFTPLLLIYYYFANREYRKNSLLISSLAFISGFFGLTLLLGAINYSLNREFLFFLPSFKFATDNINKPNPWRASSYTWIKVATWLILPVVTLLSNLVILLFSRINKLFNYNRFALIFASLFFSFFFIMIGWELRGTPILELSFYASYLIPLMFLSIGAILGSNLIINLHQIQNNQFRLLVVTSIYIVLFPLAIFNKFFTFFVFNHQTIQLITLFGVFLLFLLCIKNKKSNVRLLALFFILSILNFNFLINPFYSNTKVASNIFSSNTIYSDQDAFLGVMESVKSIQGIEDSQNLRFWYGSNLPFSKVYISIASTYLWGYRLINENFPSLPENFKPEPNLKIVILSTDDDAFLKADQAFKKVGLKAKLMHQKEIKQGLVNFKMTFIQTQLDVPLATVPILRVKDFSTNWEKTHSLQKMVVDKAAETVKLTTNQSQYDFQLVSQPIKVKQQAKYLVQFDLNIESGGAGVHVLAADRKTVIASHYWCESNTNFSQKQFLVDTATNSELSLVISNCGHPQPQRSTFWLKNLEIWQTQPVDSR